ncbi:MAG: hypothetical protein KIS66_05685 [Fimbriimonadaceae bacterium]|nr:hypothetical protein [Fimbriimonadaceae bacterium]
MNAETQTTPAEDPGLRRRVAAAGPGYRGLRRAFSDAERDRLAAALEARDEAVPRYLTHPTAWTDRRAKLFEAGAYPDKGVRLTAADLDAIAQRFDLPVPVLIEHAKSPLEIGYLTQVEALGDELFGTVALTEAADALLERSGARRLSVGLSADLGEIKEVSIVRQPRVPDAQMFGATFAAALDPSPMAARATDDACRRIDGFVREGRLAPAQADLAKAIAQADAVVEFDGDSAPLRDLLLRMIERRPPVGLFAETAPTGAGDEAAAHLLLPEEAAFYRRHFPGVSLDQIARRK